MRITATCFPMLLAGMISLSNTGYADNQMITVGDDQAQVTISYGQGLVESSFKSGDSNIASLHGTPWILEIDGRKITPSTDKISVKTSKDSRKASIAGENNDINWTMTYEVTGPGRITKSFSFTPKRDMTLQRVYMWSAESSSEPLVSRTPMQDIAAFYRDGSKGLFTSLDFPYSKIVTKDSATTVMYPPHEKLKAGQEYTCHPLTFGATRLTGKERYGFDEGEVDAVDSYVQERFKLRFNKPMFLACNMSNRYTQPEKGYVFYTMKDHPTLNYNTDLFKRDLLVMRKLGIDYLQVFPGIFDWVPGDPDPKVVKDLMDFSRKNGMHTGDYSTASGLFCGHYNEYSNSLSKPEWVIKDKSGAYTGLYSLGVPEYVDYYSKIVVENGKKYGFEMHNLDFLLIQPDYSTDKPYPAGEENLYHQVKGLVRLLEAINSISPNMMTWSNSGNWGDFLPKIAWTNHNLYLTDPFIASTWQGLNMTRLFDDARREQMVSLHYSRFIPYRFLTNYQYFLCQNSASPEIRNYQYGALSTLAVTPNLGIGEIRPWLDKMPESDVKQVEAFYTKWTGFIKKNYKLWTKTYQVGENPGMGAVEVYSHAKDNHGFIFIVNPQYWDRTVEIPLNAELGFTGTGKCEIAELHPVEKLRLTAQGPFVSLGTKLPIKVAAQQVLVLEVRPAPEKITEPRLYGIPGTVETTADGYLLKTSGQQGVAERCAVLIPDGAQEIKSVDVSKDVPKQAKRLYADTPIKLVSSSKEGALIDFTYRRTPAPTELRAWTAKPGSITDGTTAANWTAGFDGGKELRFPLFVDTDDKSIELPMWDAEAFKHGFGALANFCGGYVENALSEMQETWINLRTTGRSRLTNAPIASTESIPELRPLSPLAKDSAKSWWVQTTVNIPFMYWAGGSEPSFDEHTLLVLPMVRQGRVKEIKAWVNGVPLTVQPYKYPRNRAIACFYADLIGTGALAGDNKIVVYYEMAE
ncbi:MAG: hypothetical protein ACYC27_05240 [Armatimonadota bacterium]